jgi:hypothetical protein
MANGPVNTVIRYIRKMAAPADVDGTGDGQLLDRFVTLRDETAFEALLRRHRPILYLNALPREAASV